MASMAGLRRFTCIDFVEYSKIEPSSLANKRRVEIIPGPKPEAYLGMQEHGNTLLYWKGGRKIKPLTYVLKKKV